MWTVAVAIALVALVAVAGVALRLSPPSSGGLLGPLARLGSLVLLSGLIATPAAWAATLGRGLMTGIGITVVLMVSAQLTAISSNAAWYPFTTPAMWALGVRSVSAAQLMLVATIPALFGALTLRSWATLQLDR
jgi:ABC-2 type transport system permease protein